jgi:hypothetical protein
MRSTRTNGDMRLGGAELAGFIERRPFLMPQACRGLWNRATPD